MAMVCFYCCTVVFHVTLLAVSAICVLVTLVNSNMVRRTYPVPGWLLCLVRAKAGAVLCAGGSRVSQHSIDSERGLKDAHDDLGANSSNSDVEALTPAAHLDIKTIKCTESVTSAAAGSHRHLRHHLQHHHHHHHTNSSVTDHCNWSLVTSFVDRVAFFVYMIIMAVIGVRYLVL